MNFTTFLTHTYTFFLSCHWYKNLPIFFIVLVERNASALENNKGRKCYRDKNRYPFHFILNVIGDMKVLTLDLFFVQQRPH